MNAPETTNALDTTRGTNGAHADVLVGLNPARRRSSILLTLKTLAITGAFVALAALAPVASAGSVRGFHLDKTCADAPSEPLGYICTVTHSDFKWIPAGTDIRYLGQDGDVVQAQIVIGNGRTDGACTWSSDVDAVCVFSSGTGRLTKFHLDVVVTTNSDQSIWYWDGTYSFGG